MNYIAFLCLSDIFDSIFIDGKHCGMNNHDTYIYPAFRWGIPNKPESKKNVSNSIDDSDFSAIYEKKEAYNKQINKRTYNFLLEFMGITKVRGKL